MNTSRPAAVAFCILVAMRIYDYIACCVAVCGIVLVCRTQAQHWPPDQAETELRQVMVHLRTRTFDRIPAIDRPTFTDAVDADRLLGPADWVVGLRRGGQTKAYPLKFLDGREVVNDSLGGGPITVTW